MHDTLRRSCNHDCQVKRTLQMVYHWETFTIGQMSSFHPPHHTTRGGNLKPVRGLHVDLTKRTISIWFCNYTTKVLRDWREVPNVGCLPFLCDMVAAAIRLSWWGSASLPKRKRMLALTPKRDRGWPPPPPNPNQSNHQGNPHGPYVCANVYMCTFSLSLSLFLSLSLYIYIDRTYSNFDNYNT